MTKQIFNRNHVDAGEKKIIQMQHEVNQEVAELVHLEPLPVESDLRGKMVDAMAAIKVALVDLESQGQLDPSELPDVLEIKFSLDASYLSKHDTITNVGISLQNLPMSNQSVNSVMPLALGQLTSFFRTAGVQGSGRWSQLLPISSPRHAAYGLTSLV